MARILIVGCGDVGYRVAMALHTTGHQIIGLKRQLPPEPWPFPVLPVDIRQASALAELPDDFDLVLFMVSPDARQAEAYRALYEAGLDNLLNHFAGVRPGLKWLMVSSTSVYGQKNGEWVDETSATEPGSATAFSLLKAEQQLWAADAKHSVVRFSGIYGPGRDWLLRRAETGERIQRHPPIYTNRIHRDDCVAVLMFLIEKQLAGAALQSCYLASDHDPAPLWDVMNWIAAQFNYPAPAVLPVPAGADQNKRCRNTRLTALGYEFLYPSYRDGYLKSHLPHGPCGIV